MGNKACCGLAHQPLPASQNAKPDGKEFTDIKKKDNPQGVENKQQSGGVENKQPTGEVENKQPTGVKRDSKKLFIVCIE